ncbi:hypothetical protein BX616_001501 [Lobosporangium transversale]|nr:hypothetical protein BX616_001501 [Lobosporangium transversale]
MLALAMRSVVRYGRHSKGEKLDIMHKNYLNGKNIEELQRLVIHVEGYYCVISPTTGRVKQNDEERPLSLPQKAMPLVMDKHMAVEHGEYQLEESELNQTEIQLEDDQLREEHNELYELLRKFIHNFDDLKMSNESVRTLRSVIDTLDTLPLIPNASGTKKPQRQCY